jgi:predicted amidohydrolase YtcJ
MEPDAAFSFFCLAKKAESHRLVGFIDCSDGKDYASLLHVSNARLIGFAPQRRVLGSGRFTSFGLSANLLPYTISLAHFYGWRRASCCRKLRWRQTMETIFKNGNILTFEKDKPRAEAIAVQFGRIRRVGRTAEVEKLAAAATSVVDLKGQTLMPGFIDTHNHFCLYALLINQADCRPAAGCVKGRDVVEALKAKAKSIPPGKWIMGWGYAPYLLDDKMDLTREALDRASLEHPICLVHVSVHGAVVNSLALQELGFNRDTPDPIGGKIHRDTNGALNGILTESAFMGPLFFDTPSIYGKIMADYDSTERAEMISRCTALYHGLGLVGAHDPFVDALTLRTYQRVANTGRFPFRLHAYTLNRWADPLLAAGIDPGFGSEWVKIGAIKIFLDGGMSSRTAAVFEPYLGGGGGKGILMYDEEGIKREIQEFDGAGYQISVHAQGDRALEVLLKAFEAAMASATSSLCWAMGSSRHTARCGPTSYTRSEPFWNGELSWPSPLTAQWLTQTP